jgi:hypothetical protein
VTAAASGSSLDSARGNARAELSRVFRSRVVSEVRDESQATVVSGPDGASRSSVIEKLSIDTRVSTEGSFEGVRVAEVFRDPQAGIWHALAVVNKSEMREALRGQLGEAARRVRGDLERADAAATPLGSARALLDASLSSSERDVLVARARIVGAAPDGFEPSSAEIGRRLDTLLWNTRFQVVALDVDPVSGDAAGKLPRLREEFEKRITGMGFRIAKNAEDANVFLTSRMILEEVPRDFQGHFVRWEGSYEVAGAPPDGPVVLSSQGAGGESYSTVSVARTRALTKGAQKLAGDLQEQISRYLQERPEH